MAAAAAVVVVVFVGLLFCLLQRVVVHRRSDKNIPGLEWFGFLEIQVEWILQ